MFNRKTRRAEINALAPGRGPLATEPSTEEGV